MLARHLHGTVVLGRMNGHRELLKNLNCEIAFPV